MTRAEFRTLCESKIVMLDGATGTNLQKRGMPEGVCPELWILEHPKVMEELQREFLLAGTDILYAPTFSANRIKLEEYGLSKKTKELNLNLTNLTKRVIRGFEEEFGTEKKHYVAGDLTMTGKLLKPVGSLNQEELIAVYKEQAEALLEAGVDLFVIETMMSLAECRAAVLAVREICDLPVMVTLTFAEDGKTMYGTTPEAAMVVLQSLGADAVGVNCSTGPGAMKNVVAAMKSVAEIPVIAKPNAGLPKLINGETCYDETPEKFALAMLELVHAGASVVGGCCGSEPAHIEALAKAVSMETPAQIKETDVAFLSTERTVVPVERNGRTKIIGERINPTGKKALQAELKEGKLDLVQQYAREQEEAGASFLDINAGMSGIDEKATMLHIIEEVTQITDLPLVLDSSHVDVLEAALRAYPGRALVNSVSCEKEKMEALLPIVKKYGAMFILLPLSERGLPETQEEKTELIHTVLDRALELGFRKKDIVVDGLVNTIGAGKEAAKNTLETIRYCKEELGLATSIGLSNISFGLPARSVVNTAFLVMAIEAGLTMAIANPCQKMPMQYLLAADLLMGKEEADLAFIEEAPQMAELGKSAPTSEKKDAVKDEKTELSSMEKSPVYTAVIKGNRKKIEELTKLALDDENNGKSLEMRADKILNLDLIPAIQEVGTLFEKKKYFLPQLIASAETMELAMKRIEPHLARKEGSSKGTVVIATVKGDVHDIGKNLVALMLKNYGFDVIDLGKDVESAYIVEQAKEKKAKLIALSALMTTTMVRMKEVVAMVKEAGIPAKVLIGGAVTTGDYANEIGADGYAKDAQEAVAVALELCDNKRE